jgi:predicted transcriptional regulator
MLKGGNGFSLVRVRPDSVATSGRGTQKKDRGKMHKKVLTFQKPASIIASLTSEEDQVHHDLSKRERQIMEVIIRRKRASVREVLEEIPNPPSYSAVRAMMNILETKGFLTHEKEGRKYVYASTTPIKKAKQSAIRQLLHTYFNNSTRDAVAAIIEASKRNLEHTDFDRLIELIEEAKATE